MENQYLTKNGYDFRKSEEKRKQNLYQSSHIMHSFAQLKRRKNLKTKQVIHNFVSKLFNK